MEDDHANTKPDYKVKLMCSYGGKIQPRPHDHQLAYLGGDTKILSVDRRVKFSDVVAKLVCLCNVPADVSFKYQLPGEDLDALVSVINDDDLAHMMDEYDRIRNQSPKPARLRIFLFPTNPPAKPEPAKTPASSPLNPDFLFGFDKDYQYGEHQTHSTPECGIPPDHGMTRPEAVLPLEATTFGGMYQGTFSRESHVTAGGASAGQVVYVVPGIMYGQQPVYGFVAEPKLGFGADVRRMVGGVGPDDDGIRHVAADEGGRSGGYGAVSTNHQI